jgi:hypothetical protein
MSLFPLMVLLSTAHAIPTQLGHQGRLLDADGLPAEGLHTLDFGLYDAAEEGTLLWSELHEVDLINGYYSLVLGADELDNPLEDTLFEEDELYLELTVDEDEELEPRQALNAVPYARRAGTATNVSGGFVDASEIRIDGAMVVDTDGNWVGPAPGIDWSDISGIPDDFSDAEDADTWLSEEEVDEFCNNNGYAFAADLSAIATTGSYIDLADIPEDVDTWLSEEEVDEFCNNNGYALSVDLSAIATSGSYDDLSGVPTDADTQLSEDEVDAFCNNNGYALSADLSAIATSGSYDDLSGVPADADTQLSEDEVDTMVSNNGYSTGSHTTDTNTQLSEGEVDTMVSNNGYSTGSHTADTNTQLSESTVETYVTNGAIDLASGSTIGGSAPFTLSDLGSRIYQQTLVTTCCSAISGTATCNSGDKVLGGGCAGGCVEVLISTPSGEGWHCRCISTWTGTITITAICLDL